MYCVYSAGLYQLLVEVIDLYWYGERNMGPIRRQVMGQVTWKADSNSTGKTTRLSTLEKISDLWDRECSCVAPLVAPN